MSATKGKQYGWTLKLPRIGIKGKNITPPAPLHRKSKHLIGLGLLGVLLLSEAGVAMPKPIGETLAQQVETAPPEETRAAAERAFAEGMELYQQGTAESLQQARLKFQEALELFQTAGDRQGIAKTLSSLGWIYYNLGEYQQAIEYLSEALELFRVLGKRSDEINPLARIGFAYLELGEFEQTISYAQEVLPLIQETGDKTKEAHILSLIGSAYKQLEDREQALTYLSRAVLLYREENNLSSAASRLNYMGVIYYELGDFQSALEQLEQALPLWQATNNAAREADTLKMMGMYSNTLGNYQQAINFLNQGLNLSQSLGDPAKVADMLWILGQLYRQLGDAQTSLVYLNRALDLQESLNDPAGRATVLSEIGFTYYYLNDFEQALSYYNQSLLLWQQLNNRVEEAKLLDIIGTIHYWRHFLDGKGNYQQGLDALQQALAIFQSEGIQDREADSLAKLALYYSVLGDNQQALDYLDRALSVSQTLELSVNKAVTISRLGQVYEVLSDYPKALEFKNLALQLYRKLGDKSNEASTLAYIAKIERDLGNLAAARQNIEQAIEIIETLRIQIASTELRTSYFATVQDYYQFYIDLLMQLHQQNPTQGYDAQALHISESSRARSLLEQLTEASLDLNADLDPALKAEEQRLTQALNAAEQKRLDLLNSSASNAELAAAIAERDDILDRFQSLEARIRSANPAYANLTYPDPLTLDGIQTQILDDNTLLLEYALGEERSYLFLVGKTTLKTYTLPPKAEIEAAVEEYRQLLLSPDFKDLSQGQNLSQMLLGQIAGELQGQRLVIVGDGKLQLLPFAALPVPVSSASTALKSQMPSSPNPFSPLWEKGSRKNASKSLAQSWERDLGRGQNPESLPLLVNHEIITLPSATSLAVQRQQWQKRQPASRTVAVIADPVFKPNDPRLGENATTGIAGDLSQVDNLIRNSCGDFDRLPNTATEAEQILALVPDAQEFSAMGFDANYATATNPNLSQYRIVHLATHGCIQDNPLLSNLALSFFNADGQRAGTSLLKLQDIYNLELNADLVVLSACQTGTGKEVQGEGVVGLTRGFMYAGARRVAVSLWSVNDRATSILMSDYYRKMLEQEIDPAAALRQAQLAMWHSDSYSAPYYWAAFTLQGDW